MAASIGTVGDSYDNALAENVNGSYKNELNHARRWDDVVEVEITTFEWVSWWNETRLHQSLEYRTPVEVETEILEAEPATGNNRNQGKRLGTKPGALQSASAKHLSQLHLEHSAKRGDWNTRAFPQTYNHGRSDIGTTNNWGSTVCPMKSTPTGS
ncbi:integrase core domain-containing protein [Corynebacterium riegelii]|uniref:integrase core domain-containing protein n=1 Tax=Corynebacterium riegelii TaxID=156976 RepID=UPI003B008DCB